MTAIEMFKQLGYTRKLDSEKLIYTKPIKCTFNCFEITFDLLEKEITLDDGYEAYIITYSLLKAINKQCKELGWI